MNVLILTKNLDLPEANLFLGLERLGINLTIILDSASPFRDKLLNSRSKVIEHSFKSRFSLSSIKLIRQIVLEKNIKIVHSFSNRALSNALLATLGLDVKHVAYRGTIGHLSRFDPTAWMTYLNPKLDKIVCVSNAVREYLISKNISSEKLVHIYKGHDPTWYIQGSPFNLEQIGVPKDSFVIVSSANIRSVKGIDILIKAFEVLSPYPSAHLVLVGEVRDPIINKLISDHSASGRIHLTGFRTDAANISGAASVFCMPSRAREGLPKGVIEAMIQCVPAIVTRVGGMPELVSDGEEGYLAQPSDISSLADALKRAFENQDQLKKMGQNAKIKIESKFNIKNTILATQQLYKDLI